MQFIILFLAGAEVNDGTSLLEGQHAGRGSARRDCGGAIADAEAHITVMAALAPVAERLARRPRTPTGAAPVCAVLAARSQTARWWRRSGGRASAQRGSRGRGSAQRARVGGGARAGGGTSRTPSMNADGRCAGMRCPGRALADGAVVAAVGRTRELTTRLSRTRADGTFPFLVF